MALLASACGEVKPKQSNPDAAGGDLDAAASDAGIDALLPPGPHVPVVGSYIKAINTRSSALFGGSVALSADGNTLAVGSSSETSAAKGINNTSPGPGDTSASYAGAVYVFTRSAAGVWSQQAYIKASNAATEQRFGNSVSLSSDGNRLAVGASGEDSIINNAGAVYLFHRSGTNWAQVSGPIKASNPMGEAQFGSSVALSGDGNTLAVGAMGESSSNTGISTGSGGVSDAAFSFAGAVYLFSYIGGNWVQTHYLKPSNNQKDIRFGWSVALSGQGSVLAVGASGEASNATGVSGSASTNTSAPSAGATYIFEKDSGGSWLQAAYVKPSNTRAAARFGNRVSLSQSGQTLAVGSPQESSGATGVNNTDPGPDDTTANAAGATYVFTKSAGTWAQTAYLKASNTRADARFGQSVQVSVDGESLVVGSPYERSAATGVNSTNPGQSDTSVTYAGAAYTFSFINGAWAQTGYLKSFTTTTRSSNFGIDVAITNDAAAVAVGASTEPSNDVGVDGTNHNASAPGSGAVFTFK